MYEISPQNRPNKLERKVLFDVANKAACLILQTRAATTELRPKQHEFSSLHSLRRQQAFLDLMTELHPALPFVTIELCTDMVQSQIKDFSDPVKLIPLKDHEPKKPLLAGVVAIMATGLNRAVFYHHNERTIWATPSDSVTKVLHQSIHDPGNSLSYRLYVDSRRP